MKPFISLFIFVFWTSLMYAQFNPNRIATARPGKAMGVRTVGKGVFQIQSGINYSVSKTKEDGIGNESTSPLLVMRYGFWELIEMSAVLGFKHQTNISIDEVYTQNGFNTTQLGIRFHISKKEGARPGVAFQYRLLLPFQSQAYDQPYLGSRLILATSNRLGNRFSFGTAWGLTWNGNDPEPKWDYVFKLSSKLNDRIGSFVEMYGRMGNNFFDTNFDAGLSFLVNKNFQLDFSSGWFGNSTINAYFMDVGISWRFHNRDE